MFEVACRVLMARFVITYRGTHAPSSDEEQALLSALGSTTVVDRVPGLLLVEGAESAVAAAVQRNERWAFSAEARLSPQPHRRR